MLSNTPAEFIYTTIFHYRQVSACDNLHLPTMAPFIFILPASRQNLAPLAYFGLQAV